MVEPIAAIATPPGRGGIGIVRLSGAELAALFPVLLGLSALMPRQATQVSIRDSEGRLLDQGLALYFPAPHSFTGEDVLELHGHGGPAVMQLLLRRCLELGARLAEPGEFTKRAFLNDKIDLAQAESVADLIEAATTTAARAAVRSLSGEFSQEIEQRVAALIHLRTLTEATLDFPDEEVDFLQAADALGQLKRLGEEVASLVARAKSGSLLRVGLHVVLIGQPNVGKSSLLNRLVREELAIVTPIAGTTRDAIRGQAEIRGVPLYIIDTAGLREASDHVEKLGIERTWREIEKADLALLIIDDRSGLVEQDAQILAQLPARLPRLLVHNKIDLTGKPARCEKAEGITHVYLSAKTGVGIDHLEETILNLAGWQAEESGVFLARERHLQALVQAQEHLALAEQHAQNKPWPIELFAEELRLAQEALSSITGEFTSDDLLGEIFSRFCIGK